MTISAFSSTKVRLLKIIAGSSHCGSMGSAASSECWDPVSFLGTAQWVKNLAVPQLWLRPQLWLGHGLGTPYAAGLSKRKKRKKELALFGFLPSLSGFWPWHAET